jgi:hypothetical protein
MGAAYSDGFNGLVQNGSGANSEGESVKVLLPDRIIRQ